MRYEFRFPDVAEGIHEGKLIEWRVKEGQKVKSDEILCEIETDKAVVEIPSPKKGKILEMPYKSGDVVKVGSILVVLDIEEDVLPNSEDVQTEKKEFISRTEPIEVKAPPSVRRFALAHEVSLEKVAQFVGDDRLTEHDIRFFLSLKKIPEFEGDTRKKIQGIRAAISKRMQDAWQIPHASITIEIDVSDFDKAFQQSRERYKEVKLTYLSYFVKASALALQNFPIFNSSFDSLTDEIVFRKNINIGFAVDTENGLVVPNIKNCSQKSVLEIAKEITELSNKAREKKLSVSDITGSTFTITNLGSFEAKTGSGILNFPESAILIIGKLEAQKIPLNLTFDHRIIDGADAGRFLSFISQKISEVVS